MLRTRAVECCRHCKLGILFFCTALHKTIQFMKHACISIDGLFFKRYENVFFFILNVYCIAKGGSESRTEVGHLLHSKGHFDPVAMEKTPLGAANNTFSHLKQRC